MHYYFTKTIRLSFEDAVKKVTEALKQEGFGIVSEIDMQAKLREKLQVEYKKYKILGACNPVFAYKALQAEEKIGTMLPCNVLVIDREDGTTEVSAVNPVASMMAIENPALEEIAGTVTDTLSKVINGL
jgi:uncharacterized protein (DUF302 family)